MLAHVADDRQRTLYLEPLSPAAPRRSAFAMTEPIAGCRDRICCARSDQVDGGWKINGDKPIHLLAPTVPDSSSSWPTHRRIANPDRLATMFLAPGSTPALWRRHVRTTDKAMIVTAGSAIDVFVPDEDILGEVDEGYQYAQVRLGPAV